MRGQSGVHTRIVSRSALPGKALRRPDRAGWPFSLGATVERLLRRSCPTLRARGSRLVLLPVALPGKAKDDLLADHG